MSAKNEEKHRHTEKTHFTSITAGRPPAITDDAHRGMVSESQFPFCQLLHYQTRYERTQKFVFIQYFFPGFRQKKNSVASVYKYLYLYILYNARFQLYKYILVFIHTLYKLYPIQSIAKEHLKNELCVSYIYTTT